MVLGGAVSSNSFTYSVSPSVVTAGDAVFVDVSKAPCTPVLVEFFIDGVLQGSASLAELPSTAEFEAPANSTGKLWEVRLSACDFETSTGGLVY